eukprot:6199256-Pleurochrysis_carterae.AAC.2
MPNGTIRHTRKLTEVLQLSTMYAYSQEFGLKQPSGRAPNADSITIRSVTVRKLALARGLSAYVGGSGSAASQEVAALRVAFNPELKERSAERLASARAAQGQKWETIHASQKQWHVSTLQHIAPQRDK